MYFKYILACVCLLNFAHLKYFSKYILNSKFNVFINGELALHRLSSGSSAWLLVLYFVLFSSSWQIADQTVLRVIFVIHLFVMFE